ncbi:phosphoethanolamine--lipid A transferase [Campylobacter sp. FMV-PI01]|uniref:Phosphoethanolamine--lipid A transferase n=1 Tax=Campylobacter portucalensis TaxID=2608384 RepID=A0A6L5WGU7_9BACT|nr:phosphoethanolamine--lipid A transferase [Campylobacter portucalensis]MSN96259.1 phosphoethanolamine--lipid A transferase [Campylobacter portucalensis]
MKISWGKFLILNSLFITILNYNFFSYIFNHSNNLFINLSICVIYFSIISAIFSLLLIPYISKFISILFVIITCISSYFMYKYGVVIDSEMIRNTIETDTKEAFSYINLSFIFYILFFGILPTFFVYFAKIDYINFKKHIIFKFIYFICFLGIAFAIFLPQTKTLIPFFREHSYIRMLNLPFYPIYSAIKFTKQKYYKKAFTQISLDANLTQSDENKLMILVVGETARAKNYSLGGYLVNDTNFYTKNIENLVYFPDTYSCGTSTAISLPCMFSKSTRDEFKKDEFSENVLDVLKRVGVNVSWFGNNSGGCKGVCDRLNDPKIYNLEFDGQMFDDIDKKMQNLSQNELIVVHLQGSHGPTYYQRYPKEFKKFTPTCDTSDLATCSFESINNTYDNSLLYTDFLINELINKLINASYANTKSVLIYLSDHGESLGENGIYLHGAPYFIAPNEQKHIPMIIYSNNDEIYKNLLNKVSKTHSQDEIFSSLLGFFNVKTKDYTPSLDIFN